MFGINTSGSADYGYNSQSVTWNTTMSASTAGPITMVLTPQEPTPTREPSSIEWLREQVDEICQLAHV